jgi:hypothetical protein
MVSALWQCERCAIIGCGKSRWVCNVVKKWAEDKWNVGVVRWTNNQLPMVVNPKTYTRSMCSCGVQMSIY